MRRFVLLLSALGLSVVTFAAPAAAAAGQTLTFIARNHQGHVLGSVHPTTFYFVDPQGHQLPEGQLIQKTGAGELVLNIPGALPPNLIPLAARWGSATLRLQETPSSFVKIKLADPFVTAVSDLPGKTRLTIRYASLTVSLCGHLAPGAPVTCFPQ